MKTKFKETKEWRKKERKKEIFKNVKPSSHSYYMNKYDIQLHLITYMYRENLSGQDFVQGGEHSPVGAPHLHERLPDFFNK